MPVTVFDKFLTPIQCKSLCTEIAKRNNMELFDYYYDNQTELQFSGDCDICTFRALENYELWQIKFNLARPKTVLRLGVDEYIRTHQELRFHLTIRGFSLLYVAKFSHKESEDLSYLYKDESIDYGFIYQDDPFLSKEYRKAAR